jgi:hypothetical protein
MNITYEGPPHFASLVAQTLEENGLSVTWERPKEERGLAQVVQEVSVHMSVAAQNHQGELDIEALRGMLARVLSRFPSIQIRESSERSGTRQR